MYSQIANILSMLLGNPLTSFPGVIGVCALSGPAVHAFGDALVAIGAGESPWTVIVNFVHNRDVALLAASFGLIVSKDFNRTGGNQAV